MDNKTKQQQVNDALDGALAILDAHAAFGASDMLFTTELKRVGTVPVLAFEALEPDDYNPWS